MEKKKLIKDMIKHVFNQTCMICFGISAINGIIIAATHNYGGELKIDYLFPISIVVCSVLCGLAFLVFYIQKIPFIVQCIIHFILIVGIVTGTSYWFGWVDGFPELFIVYGVLLIIYISIWVITYKDSRKSADKINEALENNRDLD